MKRQDSRMGVALRLFSQLGPQRTRLMVVFILRVLFLVTYIWGPFQSALVINDLWHAVQPALAGEGPFVIAWDPLGASLTFLTVLYVLQVVFYWASVQIMASVAETLNLQLRESIATKLNRLPLRFFDGHQPGEILTRVTGDLDKISETRSEERRVGKEC